MSRLIFILVSLFAAAMLDALGSASALATCGGSPTHWVVCNDSIKEVGSPPEKILGTGGVVIITAVVGGAEVRLECERFEFHGELEVLGKGKGRIIVFNCKMVKPTGCKLTAAEEKEFSFSSSTGVLIGEIPGGPSKVEFKGEGAEEKFYTVVIEGSECAIAGSYLVTGQQICELPVYESLKIEHEIVCKKSGSKLKVGTEPVSLSGSAKAKLSSGLAWNILPGT